MHVDSCRCFILIYSFEDKLRELKDVAAAKAAEAGLEKKEVACEIERIRRNMQRQFQTEYQSLLQKIESKGEHQRFIRLLPVVVICSLHFQHEVMVPLCLAGTRKQQGSNNGFRKQIMCLICNIYRLANSIKLIAYTSPASQLFR